MNLKYQDVSIIILFDKLLSPRTVEFGYLPTASRYGGGSSGDSGSGDGPSFFNLGFPSEQIELLKLSILNFAGLSEYEGGKKLREIPRNAEHVNINLGEKEKPIARDLIANLRSKEQENHRIYGERPSVLNELLLDLALEIENQLKSHDKE